ncbi:MAG TPA: acyl-CoA dehydrogenase [Desulfobacteraceae bacterium]|nr:acyl-CoA dehydrogenase [Desulfobacteraceae bacterium]
MDIIKYTQEHKIFRKRVQNFVKKEIIPNIEQWEKEKIFPKSFWRLMGKEGLLCTTLPPEYGGSGHDLLYSVILLEECSQSNQSGLGAFMHSDVFVSYISTFGSDEIKKKYLPGCVSGEIITALAMTEPGVGSDLASMETTAVDDGDSVIINGAKIFISNGINCGIAVVAARNPEIENPYGAISLYVVEEGTPGFEKGNKLNKLGMHSQDTAELFFTDCRVPKKNILGGKGTGFKMMMDKLQQERLFTALWAISKSEYVLKQLMEIYKENSGAGKSIPKSQSNQFAIVEMATDIKLGRTFVDKLIVEHIAKKNIVDQTSMAKFWATEMIRRVTNKSLDICGEAAMLESCPMARHWRDIRSWSIFAGTNEIMKTIVSKSMGL